jgi:hypothetical protein
VLKDELPSENQSGAPFCDGDGSGKIWVWSSLGFVGDFLCFGWDAVGFRRFRLVEKKEHGKEEGVFLFYFIEKAK